MSLNVEGLSCARCKAYLFNEDDIVYCPVCGAPHHRECYNALGHCALEELHGTEQEYSKEKALETQMKKAENEPKQNTQNHETTDLEYVTCGMCGEKYPRTDRACSKCGTPNVANMNGFSNFDFLGGVPKDYKIAENVTADEAKRFVVANTHRYIPKFATLNKRKKVSWNWFAFLFPSGWMLSRKMFKSGIIFGIFAILATLVTYPLYTSLYNAGVYNSTNYAELALRVFEVLPSINKLEIIFSTVGVFANLVLRIISGMFGDYLYKSHTITQINKIKENDDDIDFAYRKKGGVNISFFFLALLVVQYLPSILIQLL